MIVASAALWLALMAQGRLLAAKPIDPSDPGCRDELRREAVAEHERFWDEIATAQPSGGVGCRSLFGYALALGEARQHAERLPRLFDLAAQMQDRDRQSKTFGNFRWYWRTPAVTDQNAVDFCMHDAALLWLRHKDWIPDPARAQLRELMALGVEGCLKHRVPPTYTNIAIMNAANLIVLGETLDRPEMVREGARRLDDMYAWTAKHGTHEYCSPTYYFTDLSGLLLIATCAREDRPRQQAHALLQLLWTDIALNWFPAAERLGGAYSRTYDYLSGLGGLDWYAWLNGFIQPTTSGKAERVEPYWKEWAPPESLLKTSRQQLPRLVRQSWGDRPEQSRTQMLYRDITLSCAGACYGQHDVPLAVDLAGNRNSPRCYFIADGREDPYGQKRYPTGSAGHAKALHLTPFWAGAQRTCDALGLVIYRDKELAAPEVFNLQSHFVLRRDAQEVWLDGRRIDMPRVTDDKPVRLPVEAGQPLVLRYGGAAVAVRVLWANQRDGQRATAALVDDGNRHGVVRLTIEHGLQKAEGAKTGSPQAGAALWVRVGSSLADDAAFKSWREGFESATATEADVTPAQIRLAAPGVDGPVTIQVQAPYDGKGRVEIVPEPCHGVLELDGKEIGQPLLQAAL